MTSTTTARNKGKARAPPTEVDPLLGASSAHLRQKNSAHMTSRKARLQSTCVTASIVLLSLFIGLALLLVLLAASFKPSQPEIDALSKTAFRFSTKPDSVSVLNVTDDGILVNLTIRCGIDADKALGIQAFVSASDRQDAEQRGFRGVGADWWERLRRWVATKGLATLPQRAILVNITKPINVHPQLNASSPLLNVHVHHPILVPLISGVPVGKDMNWLQPVALLALVKPVAATGDIWQFIRQSWADGYARITAEVDRAVAEVPDLSIGIFEAFTKLVKEDIVLDLVIPIPRLPGLPIPGHPLDLAMLVKLQHYELYTQSDALVISATATVPNIAAGMGISTTIPYNLPFAISILGNGTDEVMAEVVTSPVSISNQSPMISLEMIGHVIANLCSQHNGDTALSSFFQNYLHGLANPIRVKGLSAFPPFTPSTAQPPPVWALSTLSAIALDLSFPGPDPPPKVIHSVSIEHMRISEASGKVRASGTVIAEIDLPRGMDKVNVDVRQVLPDVLIFNGPAQSGDGETYPPGAFGHIRPDDYLPSTTEFAEDPLFPYRLIVRAPIENVPVDILPGRDRLLSDFVSKIVFKGGAAAGIEGKADVGVFIKGVKGSAQLRDLPVHGETWVGRQRIIGFQEII